MTMNSTNNRLPECGIHHVAIQTRDLHASIRLYRDVLGMRIVNEFGRPERPVLLLDTGDGSHIELFGPCGTTQSGGSPATNHPLVHLALSTADIRGAIEKVRAAGYEISVEPKDVQLGARRATIAFFNGPNGERIEFFQSR